MDSSGQPPLPPPGPPAGGPPPPGYGSGQRPGYPPVYPPYVPPAEGKSVSFYVALFLGLLLLVSGAFNVILLVISVVGSAGSVPSSLAEADALNYQVVTVAGPADAEAKVLRVPIVGAIAEQGSPLLGATGGTVSQIRRALSVAASRDDVRALLLDINSPGGGVTDSDEVWRLLRKFKEANPETLLVAHFGDICASGGYYIAVAADHIMARPTTMMGSIGVIMSTYIFADVMEDVGVSSVVLKSDRTPYKDILSPTRHMRDDEKAMLVSIVDEMLDRFIDIVDQGRPNLTREQVAESATGAVFSAKQSLDRGLVDGIGDADAVLDWISSQLGVDDVAVLEQRRRPGLTDLLFGARGPSVPTGSLDQLLATLLQQSSGPRLLYYWPGGR